MYKIFFTRLLFVTLAFFCHFSSYSATYNIANGDVQGLINAILASNQNPDPDIIVLATNGIYDISTPYGVANDYGTSEGNIAFPTLTGNITIQGNGATIRRSSNARVKFRFFFSLNGVVMTMENLTIRDADNDFVGGAIFLGFSGTGTFRNVKFINNKTSAGFGGAMYCKTFSTTIIENCEFVNNKTSEIGGAIYGILADLSVNNSLFTDNSCTNQSTIEGGGAIYVDGGRGDKGKVQIMNSSFLRNSAQAQGGGIGLFLYNRNTALVSNCEFADNKCNVSTRTGSGFGGGLYFGEGKSGDFLGLYTAASALDTKLDISNCTFFNNTAHDQGGGLWLSGGTITITNTTIASNKIPAGNGGGVKVLGTRANVTFNNCTISENFVSDGVGGGIDNDGGRVQFRNTIFDRNGYDVPNNPNFGRAWYSHYRQAGGGTAVDLGNNMQYLSWTNVGTMLPSTIRIANPMLLPIANNGGRTRTLALQGTSQAIDAGSGCTTNDQRGFTRAGNCDVGAFEYGGAVPLFSARINAGGPAINALGNNWSESQYFSGGAPYASSPTLDIQGTTSDDLYRTCYSGSAELTPFSFAYPNLPVGTYQIRLHMAEIYWGVLGQGARNFSIEVEGTRPANLQNLNLNNLAAPATAIVLETTIGVSDGTLNMTFSATMNRPTISGIEIIQTSTSLPSGLFTTRINAGGPAINDAGTNWAASQYFSGGAPYASSPTLDIKGTSNDDLYRTCYSGSAELTPFFFAHPNLPVGTYQIRLHMAEIYWGVLGQGARNFSIEVEGTRPANLQNLNLNNLASPATAIVLETTIGISDGTLNMTFSATMNRPTISGIEIIQISNSLPSSSLFSTRINAGGPAINALGNNWVASQFFSGGAPYASSPTLDIQGTTSDDLYRTCYSGSAELTPFFFAHPNLHVGTYRIRLHMAEIYWGVLGQGARNFSIEIEGTRPTNLQNLNLNNLAPPATVIVLETTIGVSDGTLNMTFSATMNRPLICGIEIIQISSSLPARIEQEETSFAENIEVFKPYPNPFSERLSINLYSEKQGERIDVVFYNPLGQIMYQTNWIENGAGLYTREIDCSLLPSGMYLVRLKNSTNDKTIRLVKL